ncbi:prepilin-type N-terminal cleavage/methylation domain-containing protein [Stratiformator vulcanicus]|nr:prepilin-type N-terminal cleavage/methylation domain-containing protein [Stratiformator vulcanicus]
MQSHPQLTHRSPGGFTLIEVVLALALTVVLMAAILSALELNRRLVMTGREEIERARIARAVFQRISRDLRSVTFRVDTIAAEEDGAVVDSADPAAAAGEDSESTTEEEPEEDEATVIGAVDPESSLLAASGGLTGSTDALVMQICRPPRLNYRLSGANGGTSQVSELQSVSYFVASPGAGGLAGAVGDARAEVGLSRLSGDRLAIEQADVEGNLGLLANATEVLAPEITAVYFRYFDGAGWVEAWDSSVTRNLPAAVEVTFVFEAEDQSIETTGFSLDTDESWRGVIALPLAGAYAAEAVTEVTP